MPRRQRHTRRERDLAAEMILDDHGLRSHLLTGSPLISGGGFHNAGKFRRAWELTRETLLPQFVAEHPGRRPFAWWLCDHQHERPIIAESLPAGMTPEHFRAIWCCKPSTFGFLHTRLSPAAQEAECQYLDRVGLLGDEELKKCFQ